jgi:error-prone DNA polymerase
VPIRQPPRSANGVVFVTIEDETGIANLIVWPKIFERFRRTALGATPSCCASNLQREERVIDVVAARLDDWTPRLSALRDRTAEIGAERPPRSPFMSSAKPPGYDHIVVASRNFR